MEFVAKTLFGLEEVLAEELKGLGAEKVTVLKRAVSFEGDLTVMYRTNLYCRLAIKILTPIFQFKAKNENELYDQIKSHDWTKWIDVDQTFSIDGTVNSDFFNHSKYVALKMKDAVVDQIRDIKGRRPSVDTTDPDITLNLRVFKDECTVSFDTSGELLNRRGYRGAGHLAPLNEVLAAGMLHLAGWTPEKPLHDLMCGTGTFLIEAGMMAANMPAGLFRRKFGFMAWEEHDPVLWNDIRRKASANINYDPKVNIYGGDKDIRSINAAQASAKLLRLSNKIKIERKLFDQQEPQAFAGVIISNPPYGERMVKTDIEAFYSLVGDTLKQKFSGYEAWLISSNVSAMKRIGLRASRKITLFNGSLECKFQRYDLYSGTKKMK
ncbi:MAG: THUMP domain-containing protein [Cyclobacteriaceae bacterium]